MREAAGPSTRFAQTDSGAEVTAVQTLRTMFPEVRKLNRDGRQALTAVIHQNFHQDFLGFDAATSPTGAVPVGPPGGRVGNLIVGDWVGLGGKLIRTVSFFGFGFFGSGSSASAAAAATLGPRGGLGGGTPGSGLGAG